MARWTTYAMALVLLLLLLHKAPAPSVEIDAEAAERVEAKFQQAQMSLLRGQAASLRMDETELNSFLASHLDLTENDTEDNTESNDDATPGGAPGATSGRDRNEKLPVEQDVERASSIMHDVKVQLNEDRAQIYALWNVLGKDITLQLEGKLGAENGYLKFEPKRGTIGSLPIPQSTLETAVLRLMGSPENREKFRLSPNVSDLKIENGEMVVQYR